MASATAPIARDSVPFRQHRFTSLPAFLVTNARRARATSREASQTGVARRFEPLVMGCTARAAGLPLSAFIHRAAIGAGVLGCVPGQVTSCGLLPSQIRTPGAF